MRQAPSKVYLAHKKCVTQPTKFDATSNGKEFFLLQSDILKTKLTALSFIPEMHCGRGKKYCIQHNNPF
ncbi:hypothetical protein [Cellvibrio fontiphilus]|uniref:Uncharacterized protein n=1 Tax=Cellvibrio fontiphilus TaxID=1815559 RepID=A0ABV7FG81_9GAMM